MFNIGVAEMIIILIVALVIFGPGKLPEVGKAVGKTVREFKSAVNKIDEDIKKEVNEIKDAANLEELKDIAEVKNMMDLSKAEESLKKAAAETFDITAKETPKDNNVSLSKQHP